MTAREVLQGIMSYRDVDGRWRHALQGASVDVDPKDLPRFDAANGTVPAKKAPAKKAAEARKPTPRTRR
jgi:hypothetical protein